MRNARELIIERYHTLSGREAGLDAAARRVIFRSFERTLGAWLPADKKAAILDVGCGEGAFLAFLRERGYANLHGFDLSAENARICHERGLGFVRLHDAREFSRFDGPAGGWDAVFCLDLIEHLSQTDALRLLEAVRARLAPRGRFVVQTVNMAYLGANWPRYSDITHETGYTEASLATLLRAAGFDGIELRPAWNAATWRGRARELYTRLLHRAIYLADGRGAPRIPSRDLLARAAGREAMKEPQCAS